MASETAILNWMLALPVAGGLAVLLLPDAQSKRGRTGARAVAVVVCLATLVMALMAARWMDWRHPAEAAGAEPMGLLGRGGQIPERIIAYGVGADGLSMPLLLLTAGMGVVACWSAYGIRRWRKAYFAILLFTLAAMLGVFAATKLFALLAFLLLGEVGVYFLVRGWGMDRAPAAARHYLWYSLVGMAAIFAAISVMVAGRFEGAAWSSPGWYWVMVAGLAAGIPLVPLHRWLADVVTQGAVPVAMWVVGVMQTAAAYAGMRMAASAIDIGPGAEVERISWRLALVALVTVVYGALAAAGQKDLRRVIAFGSIAQMGFIVLGVAVHTPMGLAGAAYLLVGHAVAAAMMVFIAGMIQERVGHCEIERLGGLGGHMPAFAGWGLLGFLAMLGLPGLCVFAGELLVVMGTFDAARAGETAGYSEHLASGWVWLGSIGAVMMAMLAGIWVWMYQRVFLGPPRPEHSNVARMSMSEKWILAVLGLTAVAMGAAPMVLTEAMRGAVEAWGRGAR